VQTGSPLRCRTALTDRNHSTGSPMSVIIPVPASPRPISHSTNPFSNGTAYACFCTIQRTRKGNRPEPARHRSSRHRVCRQRMDSTSAFYASPGHASSAEASLRMPRGGARSRERCGRRICERLIIVRCQRSERHTEAVCAQKMNVGNDVRTATCPYAWDALPRAGSGEVGT
jgi:hypothetical protein